MGRQNVSHFLAIFAVLLNPHVVYTISGSKGALGMRPPLTGFGFIACPMGTAHTTQTFVVFGACVIIIGACVMVTLQK